MRNDIIKIHLPKPQINQCKMRLVKFTNARFAQRSFPVLMLLNLTRVPIRNQI